MDVYEIVTNRMVEMLEQGIIPWQKGWSGTANGAYNFVSKKPYSLINQMLLAHTDAYLTFKQAQALGGTVKNGAHTEIVVFWKMLPSKTQTEVDKDGKEVPKLIPFLRYYKVFWIGDIEGIEAPTPELHENDPITAAEEIINRYVAEEEIELQNDEPSNEAYYDPQSDVVRVPMINQYENVEEYYSTLFHELTHSTGVPARLDRKEGFSKKARFGSKEYGREELVAEMGAAMLVNVCGIETDKSFRNSAGYIQNWLQTIKGDSKLVVSAASRAEKAVNYIRLIEA